MRNLAGHPEADHHIRRELSEACVDIIDHGMNIDRSEVPTRFAGRLGAFEFRRCWYYWSVVGRVPLAVAEEMYADPIGQRDVRVAGHCGRPPPSEWATHTDASGAEVIEDPSGEEEREARAFLDAHPDLRSVKLPRYVRSLADVAVTSFVESYHIDSQAGLNLFCETLWRHGLVDGGAR